MEGLSNVKLNKWLKKAVKEITSNGFTQDLHIDEIFKGYVNFSKMEVLLNSYQVFIYLVHYIIKQKIDTSNINIYLSIDLESECNVFVGTPKSITELASLIDMHSMPEIILYVDPNPNSIPLSELYRIPVLLDPFIGYDNITMFYKEYRSVEDQLSNSNYTREINIIYNQ